MALVIATALGTLGDVLPYIAVGAELRRRGHDVAFVSSPAFERQAREAALELVPVGTIEEYQAFSQDPALWDRESVFRAVVKYWISHAQRVYEAIVRTHRPGETVLFAGRSDYSARLAQEKLGIPFVGGVLGPSRLGSRIDPSHPAYPFPPWTDPFVRTRWGLRLLHWVRRTVRARGRLTSSMKAAFDEGQRLRRFAGLPERPASADGLRTELVVCLWPSWFSPRQKDWPEGARTSGFPFHLSRPGRGPGPPMAGDGSRPIVFTRGSVTSNQRSFFSVAAECCQLLRRPGVLVTPYPDNVPSDLPPGVEHVSFAPLREIFSRAAAVVHHGGIGTTADALAAGVPQLVLPMVGDQFDNGYRLEGLGVGKMLARTPRTARQLGGALEPLLTSERIHSQCLRLRDRVDPVAGCSLAADWIEERLAAQPRAQSLPRS